TLDRANLMLVGMVAEMEREKTSQRVHDAMLRKARKGYATGGKGFGYDNVPVDGATGKRSHVELRINETEAAVVQQNFHMSATRHGLKAIATKLNREGAPTPRPKCGRPSAWAPSSVREVLHRDLYRGLRTWNKTKKRDDWGQQRPRRRPPSEIVEVRCEH